MRSRWKYVTKIKVRDWPVSFQLQMVTLHNSQSTVLIDWHSSINITRCCLHSMSLLTSNYLHWRPTRRYYLAPFLLVFFLSYISPILASISDCHYILRPTDSPLLITLQSRHLRTVHDYSTILCSPELWKETTIFYQYNFRQTTPSLRLLNLQ